MGLSEKEEVSAPVYVQRAAMIKTYVISTGTVVLKVCIWQFHQYVIIGVYKSCELFSNIYLFARLSIIAIVCKILQTYM